MQLEKCCHSRSILAPIDVEGHSAKYLLSVQGFFNFVPRYRTFGNFESRAFATCIFNKGILKPRAHILFQANAVHEVVDGFFQTQSQEIVIDTGGVDETNVVFAKANGRQRNQFDAILFGI